MTSPSAFYERKSPTEFIATSACGGPWSPQLQHGGPPSALLATVMARCEGAEGMQIARLLVDFLGPMPVGAVEVEARVARPGRRIALLEARMAAGGRDIARAEAWFTAPRADDVEVAQREMPPPIPGPQTQVFFPGLPVENYAGAMEWRFVEGSFQSIGPASVWARARVPLIEGEPLSATQTLLLLVDSANGISAELSYREWLFMPLSLHVAFLEQPLGEWIHMRARTTIGKVGLGITEGTLHDADGLAATCTQSLFVSPR